MQMEMQRRMEAGYDCVNAGAPARVASLAALFRRERKPVVHIGHRDEDAASAFHIDAVGHAAMPCAEAKADEPVFLKTTSSGFALTDLTDYLRMAGITKLVVTGAVAGFCIDSTVRAGADLGFEMTVVRDAVIGFALPAAKLSARTIFDVTMAQLEADFARVVEAETVDAL